jgi:predicted DsbA family dithiol-disulfide isomerase
MTTALQIDYYTDVLCVWAWIAQKRIDELKQEWGERIEFRYHYLNLFANTEKRIGVGWQNKGGFAGFGQHVIDSASPYPDAKVNPSIWQTVRPKSSMNAHLLLKAIEIVDGAESSARYSVKLRQQFFEQNEDIGNMKHLLSLADGCGFSVSALQDAIENGLAAAELAQDYQTAQELGVKGSPSWIMNAGRQTLYGNVGYRVLNANIKEMLEHRDQEASWC